MHTRTSRWESVDCTNKSNYLSLLFLGAEQNHLIKIFKKVYLPGKPNSDMYIQLKIINLVWADALLILLIWWGFSE